MKTSRYSDEQILRSLREADKTPIAEVAKRHGASEQSIYGWRKREQGLQVPNKRPRRRVAASRPRPLAPATANSVWSYDFVFDACANGQQIKCLTVVDEYMREALAIDVAGSIRSSRVIEVLSKLISVRGAPRYLRSDNDPQFASVGLLQWVSEQGIECALIDPGKPWQNGMTESFNGKFRDECLAREWFRNRLEARVVIEDCRQHYNRVRPHSRLGYETPEAFSKKAITTLPTGAIPSEPDPKKAGRSRRYCFSKCTLMRLMWVKQRTSSPSNSKSVQYWPGPVIRGRN